ncbi:MAG: CBS domain-containing protein [Oscillospiraceae bacterium]
MNIVKILTPKVLTVFLHESDSVRAGIELMRNHSYTAIPVLGNQEEYLGCITEGDFLRHILKTGSAEMKTHEKYRIGDILRSDFCPPLGISAVYAEVAAAVMEQNFVPIVDDRNCFCGIVTRRSVIGYLTEKIASGDMQELS